MMELGPINPENESVEVMEAVLFTTLSLVPVVKTKLTDCLNWLLLISYQNKLEVYTKNKQLISMGSDLKKAKELYFNSVLWN